MHSEANDAVFHVYVCNSSQYNLQYFIGRFNSIHVQIICHRCSNCLITTMCTVQKWAGANTIISYAHCYISRKHNKSRSIVYIDLLIFLRVFRMSFLLLCMITCNFICVFLGVGRYHDNAVRTNNISSPWI